MAGHVRLARDEDTIVLDTEDLLPVLKEPKKVPGDVLLVAGGALAFGESRGHGLIYPSACGS